MRISEAPNQPRIETAHVLFMDLVGFSSLPEQDQLCRLTELQELVRQATRPHAREADDLLCLPTGDGMALVFFRDPLGPLHCALELGRSLHAQPELPLRMGLHTGPVYRVEDINGRANASGGALNHAQHLMDCGEAGHILVSHSMAELVQQLGKWPLHPLGECALKHGRRLILYNLYSDHFGNPQRPARLKAVPEKPIHSARSRRVVLVGERGAEPDQRLISLMEAELAACGHRVIACQGKRAGIEGARERALQIQEADVVIPLISQASAGSEMLCQEVTLAHEAALGRQGKPRLLPVRVDFGGPLPECLARILDPVEYLRWSSAQDDEPVAAELARAVQSQEAEEGLPLDTLTPPTGVLPLDSRFYVERPIDQGLRAAIARQDSIIRIKGARQMGKTSLLARGLEGARDAGTVVLSTDFQTFNARQLESADTFCLTLARWLAVQLELDVTVEATWDPLQGPNLNLREFFLREVLSRIKKPVVWGMDEVDRLFTCDFGSEIFGLFRSWHNERALNPRLPWSRLTLAMSYATEAHLFISDLNQSPFNVGTMLALRDFTLEQVAELNEKYGSPLRIPEEVAHFHELLGGQPYLTNRGLHELATRRLNLQTLEQEAVRDDGIFGDHLRRLLTLLAREETLCDAMRHILMGQPCPSPSSFYRLWSGGVVTGDSAREARPRCELYEIYLRRSLQ
jgi:class 3 adenylate cyclase